MACPHLSALCRGERDERSLAVERDPLLPFKDFPFHISLSL